MFEFTKRQTHHQRDPRAVLLEQLETIQTALIAQPGEALAQSQAALGEAIKLQDRALLGRTHLLFGRAALSNAKLEEAQQHLRTALDLSDSGSRTALEASLYLGRTLRDRGQAAEAIETLNMTVHDAQAWGYLDVAADAMNSLSSLQYQQGDYGTALSTLNDAAGIARRLRQPQQEAKFLSNAAQILTKLGDHQGALQHLLEAQSKLRDAPEDGRNEIAHLISVGDLYRRMGDQTQAQQCLSEALQLAEQRADLQASTAARNNIANVLMAQQQFVAAEQMFQAALQNARKLNHIGFEIDNLDGLGELYRAQGLHVRALEMHSQALQLARANDDPEGAMDALLNLGQDHVMLDDALVALKHLQEVLKLAEHAGRQQTIFEAHEWLSKTYKAQGNHQLALEHFECFHELRKTVFQEDGQRQRIMLHAQFALERSRLERRLSQQAWYDTQAQIAARTTELELTQRELVSILGAVAEYPQDPHGEQAFRVAEYTERIAVALGWSAAEAAQLKLAAQLHDLGKMGTSPTAEKLNQPTLEPQQDQIENAARMLEGMRSKLLQLVREIALSRYEHWDGTGSPDGLTGQSIPIAARIVAVVSAYTDLTRNKEHQLATVSQALREIERNSGWQFDPTVVKAALEVMR